jgi:hypothetical protein
MARDIWNLNASVKKQDLAKARQVATKAKALPVVTDADITAMQKALKADFQAADKNWEEWTSQ